MQSVLLDAPAGITAGLAWDPRTPEPDRRRALAKELVAARLGVEPGDVRIEPDAAEPSGFHARLAASVDGQRVPLHIRIADFRAATVAALVDPAVPVGLDLRDAHPGDAELRTMKRHSHLLAETDVRRLLAHWTRVQAVRDADGRGARVPADKVRLDSPLAKGWVADRRAQYRLADLSRDGWIITLAYGTPPV